MFLGQYAHSIDSKGRLTVPVKYRAALSSGAYVTQGFELNLVVYTTDTFQVLVERTNAISNTLQDARDMRRLLFSTANEVQLDGSGRILIPQFLRNYAKLDVEAMIVGAGVYFEIWNAGVWQEALAQLTDPDANSQRFAAFDLSTG